MLKEVWEWHKILIVVKTYPTPANRGVEVSCTAGITEDQQWIRLFPIPFRYLSESQRFKKYQWIGARIKKASDFRVESYEIDVESIELLSDPLPTDDYWIARKDLVFPLMSDSLCHLQETQRRESAPTLGFFRPRRIKSLEIERDESPCWTESQLGILSQSSFFDDAPEEMLEKIPYKFYYHFECEDSECFGSHRISCYDWEMNEAYRRWHRKYGASGWEDKFRLRFETEMIAKYDTHFYVGTIKNHPNAWIIVGLFYPGKMLEYQQTLFQL